MQKLIPRRQLQTFDLSTIEVVSPSFATSIVKSQLSSTANLLRLSKHDQNTYSAMGTPQRFLGGQDKWQVGGESWHWQPVTPDEAYETRDGTK